MHTSDIGWAIQDNLALTLAVSSHWPLWMNLHALDVVRRLGENSLDFGNLRREKIIFYPNKLSSIVATLFFFSLIFCTWLSEMRNPTFAGGGKGNSSSDFSTTL